WVSSTPPGAPSPVRTTRRNTEAYGVCWTPRTAPMPNTTACTASSTVATGCGVTSTSASTADVRGAATRGPRGSMPAGAASGVVTVDMVLLTTEEEDGP